MRAAAVPAPYKPSDLIWKFIPDCLHPARAQAACQGVDRHVSKPPTFTARWRRSANRVVKGPSPKGTATARLRRFRTFGCARITKSDRPLRATPDSIGGWSGRPGSCRSLWVFTSSRQFGEQRLRLFQIGRIEALGEPAVDRCEEITGFGPPALLAPQPGEAGH